jgi:chromosome partitioning protein
MPIISFANSKGGSGKTTSALLLACELSLKKDVCIIDADPRHPIQKWAGLKKEKNNSLHIFTNDSENTIIQDIENYSHQYPFVIIDLEGIASKRAAFAISQSDFVIIPMQEQQQDADEAINMIKEVKNLEKMTRKKIHFSILFTRTRVVAKSRTARFIAQQFITSEKIDCFQTEINERDAFSAIFTTGDTVRGLNPQENNGISKAIENIEKYTTEVIAKVLETQSKGENNV